MVGSSPLPIPPTTVAAFTSRSTCVCSSSRCEARHLGEARRQARGIVMPARRGVLLFVLLLAALGVLVLIATLRLRGPSGGNPTASVILTLDVPSVLPETSPPYRFVPSFTSFRRSRMTVFELTHGIRRAATDDRVRGLVLHLGSVDWGWARIAEVRDAILRFLAARKPVYARLSDARSEAELLVASAA